MRIQPALLALALAGALSAQTCFAPGQYRSNDPVAEQNFQRGLAYFDQKQYTAAFHYLSDAAQRNHARAQELMGQIFMFGYGVQVDAGQASRYFSAAASQGHRGALSDMGFYYSQVDVNLAKADEYFLAAARCGSLDAQVELGFNYEFGRGVAPNRQQAIYWLLEAAPHWGQAGYVAQWLQDPNTPHFQNADQLGNYISAKIRRNIVLSTPRGGPAMGPRCNGATENISNGHCNHLDGSFAHN